MTKKKAAKTASEMTAQPKTDEQGFELLNDLPVNHRLRAEALANADKSSDDDGLISDELIADAKQRLEREAAANEKAAKDAEAEQKAAGDAEAKASSTSSTSSETDTNGKDS